LAIAGNVTLTAVSAPVRGWPLTMVGGKTEDENGSNQE
jgi:hypothetical protein